MSKGKTEVKTVTLTKDSGTKYVSNEALIKILLADGWKEKK